MPQPLLGPSVADAAESGVAIKSATPARVGTNGRPGAKPAVKSAARRSPAAKNGGLAAAAAAAAGDEDGGTRQMFDKRTLRRDGAGPFTAAIASWLESAAPEAIAAAADGSKAGSGANGRTKQQRRATVRAYIRKRPLFEHECERGEFDVVSVLRPPRVDAPAGSAPQGHSDGTETEGSEDGSDAAAELPPRALTVHHCLHEADLRTRFIRHVSHRADAVFDDKATNGMVYKHAMAPLVSSAARGGVGALFSFGQTGSGKTHTCNALERMAASQLFKVSQRAARGRSGALRGSIGFT